jgi:hypothetical protein
MVLSRADVPDGAVLMVDVVQVVQVHEMSSHCLASGRVSKPLVGNSGRSFAVWASASTNSVSSLTRGREYDGRTPSQCSIARTEVALEVA